ncbi:MAG: carbonic anhydrase [Halodesulfurarchaeum sp.]
MDRIVTDSILVQLLDRNTRHAESLPPEHFGDVQTGQSPAAVSMTCADSRVPQTEMFDATEPGWLFTPSTIGNQVWDRVGGTLVVDGSVLYPLIHTGTEVAVVVGHTGCGAVTATLEAVRGDPGSPTPGVAKWIETLTPVVEDGLADERVDPDRDVSLVDQLVEYNVDRQVAFLRESEDVPADVAVYGFVYDFQEVYGDVPGRAYLVNHEGETTPAAIREAVPERFAGHVVRLLD